jgi:hypothetical protein
MWLIAIPKIKEEIMKLRWLPLLGMLFCTPAPSHPAPDSITKMMLRVLIRMKRLLIALAAVLAPAAAIAGSPFNYPVPLTCTRDWYVKPTGNDVRGCGGIGNECRTLQGADANITGLTGGDCVNFAAGTYNTGGTIQINSSGTANQANGYITYIGAPNHASKIFENVLVTGSNDFMMNVNGSYLSFVGFEIDGHNIQGFSGTYNPAATNTYNVNGHNGAHHHMWLNNLIHGTGGQGIGSIVTDYTIVAGNEVYDFSGVNGCSTSGISFYEPTAIPSFTSTLPWDTQPYHIQIIDNLVHDGGLTAALDNGCGGQRTDGNGIIIDDFQHVQNAPNTPYPYAVMVAGNVAKQVLDSLVFLNKATL